MELELEPLCLPCDKKRPIVIAGPCSAETEEQVMKDVTSFVQAYGSHVPSQEDLKEMERKPYPG